MTKAECKNLYLQILGEKTVNGYPKGNADLSQTFEDLLYPAMLFVANDHYADEKTIPIKPINDSDELGMTPLEEQLVPYKIAIDTALSLAEYAYKTPFLTSMYDTVSATLFPQTKKKVVYEV